MLCTNFTDFKNAFVDPNNKTTDGGNGLTYLSQAVYGFFLNGGTLCWVIRIAGSNNGTTTAGWVDGDFTQALAAFEAITGISTVAAPGMVSQAAIAELQTHCEQTMQDRFAVLDTPVGGIPNGYNPFTPPSGSTLPPYPTSDYCGLYYPWLVVADPTSQTGGTLTVPPSGHIAGIFARVDATRGVNKAPANEVVFGALGFAAAVSQSQQNWFNQYGINCLRNLNNSLLVWGARTLIEDGTWTPKQMHYVSARRFLNFIKDSLYTGLQWSVFEPNNASLWAAVRLSVSVFLRGLWEQGALLGDTPDAAFYVKCDAENNPIDQLQIGNLNVEVGVCIVKPAEFVNITLCDWLGPPQAQ